MTSWWRSLPRPSVYARGCSPPIVVSRRCRRCPRPALSWMSSLYGEVLMGNEASFMPGGQRRTGTDRRAGGGGGGGRVGEGGGGGGGGGWGGGGGGGGGGGRAAGGGAGGGGQLAGRGPK